MSLFAWSSDARRNRGVDAMVCLPVSRAFRVIHAKVECGLRDTSSLLQLILVRVSVGGGDALSGWLSGGGQVQDYQSADLLVGRLGGEPRCHLPPYRSNGPHAPR